MSEKLTPEEIGILKENFRLAGCTVIDMGDTNFEIVGWNTFPLRTHVSANPYYIELGTFISAIGRGFLSHRLSRVHAFLNKTNLAAKLAKFTLDSNKPEAKNGGWIIMASVRFVTGTASGSYDPVPLKNLVTLWFQDIAELIRSDPPFELEVMLQPEPIDT